MKVTILLSLFFFISHASSVLDSSLQRKKGGESEPEREPEPAPSKPSAEPAPSRGTAAFSDDGSDKKIKVAVDVVAPIVRVADSCVLEVCSKEMGHAVEEIVDPDWYTLFFEVYISKHFRDADYEARYNHVPTWEEVKYCIKIQQVGHDTVVKSHYTNAPADRLYFVIVGYAERDEDSESSIAGAEDACSGTIILNFKYLIDLFLTGDDFDELPTLQEIPIDHFLYTHEDSIVNFRKGHYEFEGNLLESLSGWTKGRDRRGAWWILDATLLEVVDVLNVLRDDHDVLKPGQTETVSFNQDLVGKGSDALGYVFSSFYYYILENILRSFADESGSTQWPKFSFWYSMQEDDYKDLSDQKGILFDDDQEFTDDKPGVLFISDFQPADDVPRTEGDQLDAMHYSQALPGEPSAYKNGATTLVLSEPPHDPQDVFGIPNSQRASPMADGVDFCVVDDCQLRPGIISSGRSNVIEKLVGFLTPTPVTGGGFEKCNKRNTDGATCRCDVDCGKIHAKNSSTTTRKAFTITYQALFRTVTFEEFHLKIPIVSCGLFPKTVAKPKHCGQQKKKKSEAEGDDLPTRR